MRYTPAQLAARAAYTREWRKRNKARIDAWELKNKAKRNRQRALLARKRRESEAARHAIYRRARRAMLRAASKAYRAKMLSINPNFYRENNRTWADRNPNYCRDYYHRRKLRLSVNKFASVLASNRVIS